MAETMGVVEMSVGLEPPTEEFDDDEIVSAMSPEMAEVEQAVVTEPKPKRVCAKCGHVDGNSVGRIKRGRIIEVEQDGMKLFRVEPTCNVCIEQMPPEEKRKIAKIGYLISVVGVKNRLIRALAAAMAYWQTVVVGTAEPLHVRRDKSGKVLCGVPGCRLCHEGELATRFAVVRTAEGKYEVAGICREQMAVLIKAGALRYIHLFGYRGAQMEAERRQKKAAGEIVSPPKQSEPPAPVVAELAPASQPQPAKKLSRVERERRRDERRARLAAALEHDKAEAAKRGVRYVFGDESSRHNGGNKKNGGKDKRRH